MANGSRIVLQEPESGLDIFLREIARYASPQYQLSLREQERADARLELSKRQMDENEERYQDSLRQQKFRNDRAIASENIAKERFEIEKSDSDFAMAKQYINESISGMNAQEIAGINIDSYLIDVADPRAKSRARQYINNIQKAGRRQLQTITSRMNLYNQGKDSGSQISKAEALDLFGNDKTYNEFLVNSYLKQGTLTDEEKYLINSNTSRLTALRKNEADLMEKKASGLDVSDEELANVIFNIKTLQGEIDSILRPSTTQRVDSNRDPYSATGGLTTPVSDELGLSPLIPEDTFASDDMYNVLFSDQEGIFDSAVNMANRNASGENIKDVTLLQDESIDRYDPTDESLEEDSAIPPAFVETASDSAEDSGALGTLISGLSSVQAEDTKKPKRKTRSRFLPLIDFTARLSRLDSFQEQLDKTPSENKKKQESLNKKINKVKNSIIKDFSKIYDASEGALSIDPRYTERTSAGTSMSRNELARLISIYNEGVGKSSEKSQPSEFTNTMRRGLDNMLQGAATTLDLLQYRPPYR